MPDLRELRAFVAVAEHLGFTRAAERLHLTQQTVSKTVSDLEAQLGVELLTRTTREVRLTAAGEALLDPARATLRQAEAAFAAARRAGAGLSGRVRVGVSPAIGPRDRDDVVDALRADGADVSVSFHELRPADLRDGLRTGTVDLALLRASGLRDPALAHVRLRPSPIEVALPAGHALAGRERIDLADLDGERLLCASAAGTPYTDLLLALLAEAGAAVEVVESAVTGADVLLSQLAGGRAVAIVPTGTRTPPDVVALPATGGTLPMLAVWLTGTSAPAVRRLERELAAP